MTEKYLYQDEKQLLNVTRAINQEKRQNAKADIIRNEQGRFITVYMPNVPGSFEQVLSDLQITSESDLISSELSNAVSKYIKARKLVYESGAGYKSFLTTEQAKRIFRSIRED